MKLPKDYQNRGRRRPRRRYKVSKDPMQLAPGRTVLTKDLPVLTINPLWAYCLVSGHIGRDREARTYWEDAWGDSVWMFVVATSKAPTKADRDYVCKVTNDTDAVTRATRLPMARAVGLVKFRRPHPRDRSDESSTTPWAPLPQEILPKIPRDALVYWQAERVLRFTQAVPNITSTCQGKPHPLKSWAQADSILEGVQRRMRRLQYQWVRPTR